MGWIDMLAAWYFSLPAVGQAGITLVAGLTVAWAAFRIIFKLAKGVIRAIVAAVLAFLLATVPGNLILHDAYTRLRENADISAIM